MQLAQCILLFAWIFVSCVEYVFDPYNNNTYFVFSGVTGFALGCWILSTLMLSFELCPCNARTARENGNMGGNCCFAAKATHSDGGCNQVKCISINQLVMNIFVFLLSVAGCVFGFTIGSIVVGAVIALLSVVLIAMHSVKLCGCCNCGRRTLDQYPNTFNGNATINSAAAFGSSSAPQLQQVVAHSSQYEDGGDDDALLN